MDAYATTATGEARRELVMLRGLPGAGKTTRALELVAAAPPGTAVRVGVDDVCSMLYGADRPAGLARVVWNVVVATATAAFRAGVTTVVVDAPNLGEVHERALTRLAAAHEAALRVEDLSGVPVEECRRRNRARRQAGERSVADSVIGDLATR